MIYIAMLRGINVSGQKTIKMDALKTMFENMGFKAVSTYIQSGNIVFSGKETDCKKLETKINVTIEKHFGYDVPVIVLTNSMLQDIIAANPYSADNQKDKAFLHITFLNEAPFQPDLSAIKEKKLPEEAFQITDKAVYLYCPLGYGTTKLNNTFWETKLKTKATTRNWKTVLALQKMASGE